MALSNAEKVRRYREKQKAKKQEAMKRPTPRSDTFKKPFFEFYPVDEQVSSLYCQSLELAGIEPLLFKNDDGPESATLDDFSNDPDQLDTVFGELKGNSLGKAEVIIGCLFDAAIDLAGRVQDYKKREITARITEIESSATGNQAELRETFEQVAALKEMLEKMNRTIRIAVPVWKPDLVSEK